MTSYPIALKAVKLGTSIGFYIPSFIVKEHGIKVGDRLVIIMKKQTEE